jgi:toxin YoeB
MSNNFSDEAWEQYTEWQLKDRTTAKKINELIKDINRNGLNQGIGKPEPLRHRKAWSRRIDYENRLVYNLDENKNLIIISCKGHYED